MRTSILIGKHLIKGQAWGFLLGFFKKAYKGGLGFKSKNHGAQNTPLA